MLRPARMRKINKKRSECVGRKGGEQRLDEDRDERKERQRGDRNEVRAE